MTPGIGKLALAVCAVMAGTAALGQETIGQSEYMTNCAVCHGSDGKGDGPILDFLKAAPADLTQIAARNGGRFPFQTIYDTIADVESNRAHGTADMPAWGNRFNLDIIAEEGEYAVGTSALPSAQTRILELIFYLGTIQE